MKKKIGLVKKKEKHIEKIPNVTRSYRGTQDVGYVTSWAGLAHIQPWLDGVRTWMVVSLDSVQKQVACLTSN
jgi:hypothetical protein